MSTQFLYRRFRARTEGVEQAKQALRQIKCYRANRMRSGVRLSLRYADRLAWPLFGSPFQGAPYQGPIQANTLTSGLVVTFAGVR